MVVVRDFAMIVRGSQDQETDQTPTAGSVNPTIDVIQEGLTAISCNLLKSVLQRAYADTDLRPSQPLRPCRRRQKQARIGWSEEPAAGSHCQLAGPLSRHSRFPRLKRMLFLLSWDRGHSCACGSRFGETPMRLQWTNRLRSLLALCLLSGLVACGSFASCFNSGFASVACGGGYGESSVSVPPPTASSAEGHWTGTTRTGRTVRAVVLEDGSYWVFYTARDNPHVLDGLIQGTGTSHSGSFGSPNTRDFPVDGTGIRQGRMSGTSVPKERFHATIIYFNGETERVRSTYVADAESAPNLNLVAGIYTGLRADDHTVTVTVDAAGTLSGYASDGCTFAGTVSPRATGHAFHVTMTFEGGACRKGTETVTGVAFYDAATNRLYGAALNNARTTSFLFLGTKE